MSLLGDSMAMIVDRLNLLNGMLECVNTWLSPSNRHSPDAGILTLGHRARAVAGASLEARQTYSASQTC